MSGVPPYIEAAEELRKNPGQWSAYESEGNCVVLAGPGAGKTKTITIKIARLLDETVRKPQQLACITYSNACVGELMARLRKLGLGDDSRLLISTVHSFCLTELVLPYAQLAGVKATSGTAQEGWLMVTTDKKMETAHRETIMATQAAILATANITHPLLFG